MTSGSPRIVRFCGFALDPVTGELWRDGEPVDLPPQPARVLALLARSPGRIVSRGRIREEVWSDTIVEFDQAINNAVRQVRHVLGDDASAPRFIETVPRRGYRFIAALEPAPAWDDPDGAPTAKSSVDDTASASATATHGRRSVSKAWLGVFTAVTIGIAAAIWVAVAGGPPDPGTVLAVVPARATTAGSSADAVADTLTPVLLAALSAVESRDVRVIPWTWDMGVDTETGRVVRNGEIVDVDLVVETNVYQEDEGIQVSATLTGIPGRNQVWYRRVEGLAGSPGNAAARVSAVVLAAVRDRIDGVGTAER